MPRLRQSPQLTGGAMAAFPGPHQPVIILVGLLCIAAASPAQADGSRDVVGSFELRDVTVVGESVTGTLAVEVLNASDADVTDATLTVEHPILSDAIYAAFPPVSVAAGDLVRLSAPITVPQREYAYWRQGGAPSARLVFIDDATGEAIEQIVGLSPMPLSGAE